VVWRGGGTVEVDGRPVADGRGGRSVDAVTVDVDAHVGAEVEVRHDGRLVERVALLAPPPGRLLSRVATITDLHVGEPRFGLLPHVAEPRDTAPRYAVRCAAAAVAEAAAWGAELLVVRGDLTWTGRAAQWEQVADVLAASPVPVVTVLGNHDCTAKGVDGRRWLEAAGVRVVDDVDHVDVPGLRVVLVHTPARGQRPGYVPADRRQRAAELAHAAPDGSGVLVVMHHYPDRFRWATRYPHGVVHQDAAALLRALPPGALVTTGHSHRHRRYVRDGVEVSETGSTKDYPGVWAGYAVHEGGLRQVVRRVEADGVLDWTERTAAALGGFWGRWTPGRRSWRCFTHEWPDGAAAST
jgi:Icc protein